MSKFTQSFIFDFRSQVILNEGFLYFYISSVHCFDNENIQF